MSRNGFKLMRPRAVPVLICCALAWAGCGLAQTVDAAATDLDPDRAWVFIELAREAAGRDSHHAAVDNYLTALSLDGRLVPVVAREIAYQMLWREDADMAIFYFNRHLASHPAADNRDVRRGLALAYSWSGRQGQAIDLYRQLVADDSQDGAARVGLGRTLIWDNRLRAGFGTLRAVEEAFAADSAPHLASRNFILTYLDGYETPWGVDLRASWDSDDLDKQRLRAVGTFSVLGNKLLQIEPSVGHWRQPIQGDITAPRLKLGFMGALSHRVSFHLYGWLDAFRSKDPLFGDPETLDWRQPGADAWVTWLPKPRLRLDFGAGSQAVETFVALHRHLHQEHGNLSADWRFHRRWSAGATVGAATFSDGNDRTHAKARLIWRREGTWKILVGPELRYMDDRLAYPGGYWSPDWVRHASLTANLTTRTGLLTFLFDGSLGLEKETGSDSHTVGGASARVGWRLSPGALVYVEGGYSRSSFASDSGYKRTFAGLGLRSTF